MHTINIRGCRATHSLLFLPLLCSDSAPNLYDCAGITPAARKFLVINSGGANKKKKKANHKSGIFFSVWLLQDRGFFYLTKTSDWCFSAVQLFSPPTAFRNPSDRRFIFQRVHTCTITISGRNFHYSAANNKKDCIYLSAQNQKIVAFRASYENPHISGQEKFVSHKGDHGLLFPTAS